MKISDMKIGTRLFAGIAIIIAVLCCVITFQMVKMKFLGHMQDEGGKRNEESVRVLQIDGQPYPVQYASWRSSGSEAVIGARLQLEAISLYPGPDARGAFWSVQVRDWGWSWEALTDENRI